jgi:hypothetical protein
VSARDDKRRRQRRAREQRKKVRDERMLFGSAAVAPTRSDFNPVDAAAEEACVSTIRSEAQLEQVRQVLAAHGVEVPVRLAALIMAPFAEVAEKLSGESENG